MRWKLLSAAFFFGAAVLAGGGCSETGPSAPARDFNELIPRMLGSLGKGTTPEEQAANLFNVTSPDERRDAVAYLETKPWGHGPAEMTVYELLVRDSHPMVRAQAMRALGSSYQAPAADYLARGLDKDGEVVEVRRDAAYGLIFTWNDAAFPVLIKHLDSDEDMLVRGYCARALGHAHSADAVHALIDALNDSDAGVVRFAHGSLVSITGQDFYYDPKPWLAWYQNAYAAPQPAGAATAPVASVPSPATQPH